MSYIFLDMESTPATHLEQECQQLEARIRQTRKEIARRQMPEKECWAVPVFVMTSAGSGQTVYHLFDTAPEAYNNAYRIRVTENPLYDATENYEDDYTSRYRVKKVYRGKPVDEDMDQEGRWND
jgi:4-diphosphocytidyl-2C-methyl-D-erythritol kinase